MKKTLKAFSYAEIIAVVVIIGLVSSFGVVSFFDFMKGREIKGVIENIKLMIKEEDNKVISKEIIDYNIIFQTKNKTHFILFENVFGLDSFINFDFNNNIVLIENYENNQLEKVNISIYENGKLNYNGSLEPSGHPIDLKKGAEYSISGYFLNDNKKNDLNNIKIIGFPAGDDIIISNIMNNEIDIYEASIINLGGEKSFKANGIELEKDDEIKVFFEKDGVENFIKLN